MHRKESFSAGFDRCFVRVYAYVSRRVNDQESCERIVRDILAANLDLLVGGGDERQELIQLKAASDRLIGLESARTGNASPTARTDAVEGAGDIAWQVLLGSPSG